MLLEPVSGHHTFLIHAPYQKDEGMSARRAVVRPAHLEKAKQLNASGFLRLGGPLLSPESLLPENADAKNYVGSFFLASAPTTKDVWDVLHADVYWSGEIWDKENVVVLPVEVSF